MTYAVDDRDSVRALVDIPQSCTGAPLPCLVADESAVHIAYIISNPAPDWDGTTVNVVGPETEVDKIAIVSFHRVCAHMFGMPNDEAFDGHPLASRGLEPYGAFAIDDSSWVRILAKMNSVHPRHTPDSYSHLKHFVLAFHDSTFECVASGFEVQQTQGSITQALSVLLDKCE